jgi:septal ring factor EnvC (AmiA/AmiB activator)
VTDRLPLAQHTKASLDALYAEIDRLAAELADYDERTEQQKQRADEAEQHLRNIAQGGPRAEAVQAEIGEMIRQTHELRDQLRRAEAELQQHAENESADAAAGSYALRAECVEARLARVTALYEQWVKAGPPPLGVLLARWWDARLVELHAAIRPPADESTRTTPDNPPTSSDEAADLTSYLAPDPPIGCLNLGQPKET